MEAGKSLWSAPHHVLADLAPNPLEDAASWHQAGKSLRHPVRGIQVSFVTLLGTVFEVVPAAQVVANLKQMCVFSDSHKQICWAYF